MSNNNRNGRSAARARGFVALVAMLAIGLGLLASPVAAAPFALSSTAPAINPVTQPVTLQVGTFTTTIPPGSFRKHGDEDGDDEHEHEGGVFTFKGVIDGVRLKALIKQTGTLRYAFLAKANGANLAGTKNPVYATLTIGNDSGATSITTAISP